MDLKMQLKVFDICKQNGTAKRNVGCLWNCEKQKGKCENQVARHDAGVFCKIPLVEEIAKKLSN